MVSIEDPFDQVRMLFADMIRVGGLGFRGLGFTAVANLQCCMAAVKMLRLNKIKIILFLGCGAACAGADCNGE